MYRTLFAIVLALLCIAPYAECRESFWNHLRYQEPQDRAASQQNSKPDNPFIVKSDDLYPVGHDKRSSVGCRVHRELRKPLRELLQQAFAAGHLLVAQSCFRSLDYQVDNFLNSSTYEDPLLLRERARVSAFPGFSEHHTGYAIDFCDGEDCKLEESFAQTGAGQWLLTNGRRLGFVMSFPQDSSACVAASGKRHQGVNYEPWHWRYVGNSDAAAIFRKATEQFPICPAM